MLTDRKTALLLGDILALGLSFLAMVIIRFRGSEYEQLIGTQARAFVVLFVLWLVVFFIFDLYNLRRVNPNPRNIGLLALAIATSALIGVLYFYLFPSDGITPKTNLAIVAAVAFFLLAGWRRIFYSLFASTYRQRIAVIGEGEAVDHLLADLGKHPQLGTVVYTAARYDEAVPLPPVHLVIIDGVTLSSLMKITEATGAEVLSLSGAYEELFAKIPLALMNDERAVEILTKGNRGAYRIIERAVECLVAIVVLLIASPFMLLSILAILIEDGRPVILRQARTGKNGVPFSLFKLRSMRALAPDGSAEVNGAQWAGKRDPRITRVGKVLRATHLDEVPQMANILRGDIALIGPRPERPEITSDLERQIPYYFLRHSVKPGFTGWAQIKFRYARTILDSKEKLEYDLYYFMHKNPLFDLGILAKTVQIIFTH